MTTLTPCLWFDTEGEEAATFYTSVFKNSRILSVNRYGEAGPRPPMLKRCFSVRMNIRPRATAGVLWQSSFKA